MNIIHLNHIYKSILLFSITILISSFSFAAEWKYIGYGKVKNNDIFYVFVDTKNKNPKNNSHTILQKHIFNNIQKSKNGDNYIALEIERDINCKDKTITNNKAIFLDIDGNLLNSYKHESKSPNIVTENNSINYKIFKNFCN